MRKLDVLIAGSTGYIGVQLVKLLLNHPNINIKYLCGNSSVGKNISFYDKDLKNKKLPKIVKLNTSYFKDIDIIFTALPNGEAQILSNQLLKKNLLIDLAADFRLKDPEEYNRWYKLKHKAINNIPKSIYALPELCNNYLKKYKIIACPGCYPTSLLLPLSPLFKKNLISHKNIVIDSKSGFSGAGSQAFNSGIATFDNIRGDGPCVTLRNMGSNHTERGPLQVYNGSTNILATRNDGRIDGNFNDTSDRAFKENINSITSSLKEVNELRPVTFVWKQDEANGMNRGHGETNIGFIAQEVSESLPRLVTGVSGSVSGMSLNTIGITSVLTKAVQELTEEIRFLRASITGSTDINQLKALVSGSTFV